MQLLQKLIFALAALFIAGCIERFEVPVERRSNIYVVEGRITNLPEYQSIRIRRHTQNREILKEVSRARVSLERHDGSYTQLQENRLGEYRPAEPLQLEPTSRYRLHVALGDTVRVVSTWQEVPSGVGIADARAEAVIKGNITDEGFVAPDNGFNYFITTIPSPVKNLYLRYDLQDAYIMEAPFRSTLCTDCNGCFIVGEPHNILKTNAIENGLGKQISDFLVTFVPVSVEHSIRNTVRLLQFAITEEAYEYYTAIELQQKLSGTTFDPPPAIIRGNLMDTESPERTVYGFFELSTATEASVAVRSSDAPFRVPDFIQECTLNNGQGNINYNKPECFDCRTMEGATHQRPAWF